MMSVRGRIAAMHNIVIVFGRDSGQVRERVVRDRVGSCSREEGERGSSDLFATFPVIFFQSVSQITRTRTALTPPPRA